MRLVQHVSLGAFLAARRHKRWYSVRRMATVQLTIALVQGLAKRTKCGHARIWCASMLHIALCVSTGIRTAIVSRRQHCTAVSADGSADQLLLHAVKSRIKSVQNIKKITSAMKMVAASKMRKAQAAQEQAVGMPTTFMKLFGEHTSALSQLSMGLQALFVHLPPVCRGLM